MKKLLILLLVLMCCGCQAKREDYYVLHFDDYSLTPGYDNAEYVKLVYTFDIPEEYVLSEKSSDGTSYVFTNKLFPVTTVVKTRSKENS